MTSEATTLNAADLLEGPGGVPIRVGNQVMQVTSGSQLTPAQYVATGQMLATGRQQIIINAGGAAVGGSLVLTNALTQQISNLTVPTGVTAVRDFAVAGNLALGGSFVNQGKFYALSTSPSTSTAAIAASVINNDLSGIISSILPAGGVAGFSNSLAGLNLSLSSAGAMNNAGRIESDGNISLFSGSGSITNNGAIHSHRGSINLDAPINGNMTVSGTGLMQASAGSINVRSLAVTDKVNTFITGGTFIAPSMNVFSGDGSAEIDIHSLTGRLNINAGATHVTADTGTLELGNIVLTGDPTFYNANGDVIIGAPMIFSGQALAIVASRNIITAPGAGIISTASSAGSGGQINLIAGANFLPSGSGSGDTTTTLTLYGASKTGGKIDLGGTSPITALTSQSTGGGGSGGDINLIAFNGTTVGAGSINVPASVTINAGGDGAGANGDVLIVGALPVMNAVTVGNIDSSSGAANTGSVIVASTKVIQPGPLTVFNGAITSGTISADATPYTSVVSVGNVTTNGGAVNLTGGSLVAGTVNAASATANGGSIVIRTNSTTPLNIGGGGTNGTGFLFATGAGNGGTISITQTGTGVGGISVVSGALNVAPGASGDGGNITLNGTGGVLVQGPLSVNGTGTGKGGTINITSGLAGNFVLGAGATTNGVSGAISSNGAGGGGTIDIKATAGAITAGSSTISASGAAGAGNGGIIKLTAPSYNGAGTLALSANGAGTGKGGSIEITSQTSGSALNVGAITATATGGATSGDGGSVKVTSAGNIGVAAGAINVSPTNGKGGTIDLTTSNGNVSVSSLSVAGAGNGAGGTLSLRTTGGTGNIFISGSINANGSGTGNGGTVSVMSLSTTLFNMAAAAATNGITGSITADAGLTAGDGGSITVVNSGTGGLSVRPAALSIIASPGGGNGGKLVMSTTSSVNSATPGTSNLTIQNGNLSADASGSGFNGGTVRLNGRTTTFSGTTTLSANGTGSGNGGIVELGALSFSNPAAAVTINANGGTSGNGGSIRLYTRDSNNAVFQDITTGGAAGQWNLAATGGSAGSASGNGGQIQISSSRHTTLDPAFTRNQPLGLNGNGGNLYVTSGYNTTVPNGSGGWMWAYFPGRAFVNGNVDANGVGTGNGGAVSFSTNWSANAFTVAAGSVGNGVNGIIMANGGATSGNGGSITLNNSRQGVGGTTVSIPAWANIQVAASPGGGNGGNISLGTQWRSGMSIPGGTLDVSGTGANGNGGSVALGQWDYTFAGTLNIIADGSGTGNGGTISFDSLGNNQITVDNVVGGFTLSADSGALGGNGGQINIRAGRNLYVDPAFLSANPNGPNGNGGRISLNAANQNTNLPNGSWVNGSIFIDGDLRADGVGNGDGGYISLGQYSAAVMTIAPGTASNGVNGIVSANAGATGGHGGRINIGNSGRNGGPVAGGLSVPVIGNVQAVTTYGDGSDISLYTDGTLTLSSGVWSAGAVGEGYGGDIQLNGGAYNITGGGNLLLQVNGAGSGKGGYVEITAWGPGAGAFNIGSGSGQISIEAMSGLLGGDGGEIYMDGQNCTIDLNAIKMMPRGPEGSGDYIELDITGSITGNLDISGKGSGDGGGFYSYGSGGNLTIDANIIANSGANGGWGGGFDVEGGGNVTASGSFLANGVEGGGWHYWGPWGGNSVMTLTSGTVLEANGTGVNAPGGEIMVGAEHVGVSGGGTAYIRANGTAAGGYVDIESWDTIGDVTIGSVNGFTVEATGGANHEGGSMYVYAGRNVTVEGPAINLAGGTYGGWLALESSGTTQGNLQISGDLSLANTGTGAGGDLELVYRSTNPFVIGGALTESGITGSINVSSAYGTGGTVYLHNQAASGVNLVMNGTIDAGSSNHNNFGTITLSTQGQAVSATGTGTMIGLLDATGTSVNLNLTGAGSEIQVARAVATAGSVTLIASGADSSIFIPGDGANVTATTTISIASPTFASQRAISSSGNGDISISADSVSYSTGGSINAGTGNVSITPLNNTAMLVGAGTDVDGLHLSQVELEAITASRLTLGDITKNGSITINGSFDTSGAGAGAYDLVFNTAGTYTGTGHTITIGTNTYALDATGGGFLGGISGGATTVTVNSGADLTIDGAIAAPGGAISITGANAGSILSGGGSLTATDVTLTSTTGSIGTAADPIDTFATNLQANTDGSIYLNQTGAVNMQASSAGATGTFSLNITGGIFTPVGTVSGDTIRFTTDSTYSDAGTNLLSAPNIFITSTGGDVNLTAGYSATGSITLSAPNGGVNSAEATVGLDTPNLTITSGAGGVDVALTTATTLNVTSSGGVVITDTANSLITGAINAPSIDLTMPNADSILTTTTNAITLNTPGTVTQTNTGAATVSGSVGSLNLTNIGNLTAGVVTAVNSVTYTTSGAGSVLSGTGVTTADTLTINSAEDVSLDTAVLNLNLNMAGAVATIDNTGDVTTGSVVADAIDITTSGNLTMGAAINVPNSLQLVSTGGDITQIAGTLTADTAVITASNGNIGASGAAISIDFNQLTANAANGSAYFDQNGALTVGGNSGALNDFEINVTGGGLTNNQILSGNNLVFSSNGDVVVSGTGQINATGTIQFNSAAGLVNVNQTAFGGTVGGSAIGDFTVTSGSALVVGNVDGANVNLFTTNATINGAVSANAGNVLIQNSGNLSVGGTGSLSATGDNILRAGAGNTLNLSGTLSGSSFTTDARTVNNTGAITSNGDFNFTNTGGGVMTIANTGTLASSTGAINLTNAAGIVVNGGTGVLNSATTITATATNGAVDVTQNTIDGNIGGTAGGGNFSVTTTASDLNVTNTTARTNVSLTSALDLNVSAGASLTAGTMNGAANPTSTNMADYNINAIVAPGAVTLRAVTGDIDLAAGSQLQSRGGNVWMRADQNITSTNASFFAQAGNVEMCADNGAINITGGTMTAVARSNPANPNVNIDGHSIPYFQGGGVGIFSGVPNIDMGAALWSDQMARVSTGSMNMTGGVTTTGSTFNYTQNAGSINFLTQGGGTISAVASSFTASGGVIQVDPPTDITINGLTVTAVAPALTPPVPPIPPGPTPVLIVIPPATPGAPPAVVVTTVATVVSPVQSPATTILPTDATKEVTTYTPIVGERVCVPVVMAQQSDAGPEGWNIAAGACQSFAFQSDDGTTIAGTGGTAVRRTGANQVEMRNGKLVTMTGKEELSVTTSAGVVTLPAGSAAIIDESKQGVLRVEYLNGNPATVKVTGKDGKTSIVNAERGQEVVIADSDADDEDLIPVDGVERIAVEARLQFSGVQVRKNKFDREVLIAKDPLVNCNAGCLPTQVRNKMKKLKDDISATKPTKDTIGTTPTSPFRPVAQISPVATAAKLNRMSTGKASMCYGSNALISSISDDSVDLHEGEMLITVDNKVSVRTPQGVVALAPNTVALIRCKGDLLSASIMYEEHARSAQFVSHGKAVHIAMGGELVATTRAGVLDKFIKDDDVGRRRVRQADMPNGGEVMTSEVPFLSLLGNSSVLRGMFKSELEDDQELCSKLRKAAVAISVVTARHGSYAPVQPR